MQYKTLVIGIGNIFRRDDGIGPIVAGRIKELNLPGTKVVESSGDLTALADEIQKHRLLIIVDSISSGGPPGSIYKFEPFKEKISVITGNEFSTHSIGIVKALELLENISGLPERITIYGIEGVDFGCGEGLSVSVAKAADELIHLIIEVI